MTVPIAKRVEASLYLMRNEFDVDKTAEWFLREYADDPTVMKASNKEKLARNIVIMGGGRAEQEMNIVAHQLAVVRFVDERQRQQAAKWDREKESLEEQVRKLQEKSDAVDADYRDQVRENQRLNALMERNPQAVTL